MVNNIFKHGAAVCAAMLLLVCGCAEGEIEKTEDVQNKTEIKLNLEMPGAERTKSVLGDNIENRLGSVIVAAYNQSSGLLEYSGSFSSGSDISLIIDNRFEYKVYVLGNMPSLKMPDKLADVSKIEYRIPGLESIRENGIPAAGQSVVSAGDSSCDVSLQFLLAKIEIKLNAESFYKDIERLANQYGQTGGKYSMTKNFKIYAKGLNVRLLPFGISKASSASDIMSGEDMELNFDSRDGAVLYVPENMQGNLLSGNSDPYSKIPENLSLSQRALCSYINITFDHDSSKYGVGGKLEYNFFLGGDMSGNFDVERNKIYSLSFTPLLSTVYQPDTWLKSTSDWNDSRVLSFSSTDYKLKTKGSCELKLNFKYGGTAKKGLGDGKNDWTLYLRKGSSGNFVAYNSASSIGLESVVYNKSDDSFTVKDKGSLPVGTVIELKAETFDGRKTAQSKITVTEARKLQISWDTRPEWIAQKAVVTVSNFDDGASLQSFSATSGSTSVRISGSGNSRTLSFTGSSTVVLKAVSTSGQEISESIQVKAPRLIFEENSYTLSADGSECGVLAYYTDNHPNKMDISVFDPALYQELLLPVYQNGNSELSQFLGVAEKKVYVQRYANSGKRIEGLWGTKYSNSIIAKAKNCSSVSSCSAGITVRDPFPGADASHCFGLVDNLTGIDDIASFSTVGSVHPFQVSNGHPAQMSGYSQSITIDKNYLIINADNQSDLSLSFNGSGHLLLSATNAAGQSWGRIALKLQVRNKHNSAEKTLAVAAGYFDCFYHNALALDLRVNGSEWEAWPKLHCDGPEDLLSVRGNFNQLFRTDMQLGKGIEMNREVIYIKNSNFPGVILYANSSYASNFAAARTSAELAQLGHIYYKEKIGNSETVYSICNTGATGSLGSPAAYKSSVPCHSELYLDRSIQDFENRDGLIYFRNYIILHSLESLAATNPMGWFP